MERKPLDYVPQALDVLRRLDTILSIIGEDEEAWKVIKEHFETSNEHLQELLKKRGLK